MVRRNFGSRRIFVSIRNFKLGGFRIPYYFFALVFAFVLAKKARATNLVTIPDKLFDAYDTKTSLLGALLTFVLISPAPYVLMLGILVQLIFGISLAASVLISTFLTVCYLYAGDSGRT